MQEKQTRRQAQAQESRARIMEAALQLFARNGYKKTSVHMICSSLGMADSLLYHYFPGGKNELMQTLLQEEMLLLLSELNTRNDRLKETSIGDMLEKLYQDIEGTVMHHADLLRIVIKEDLLQEMVLNDTLQGMIRLRHAWFANLLEKQAEKGEISPMDYASAAETLDSLMLWHLCTQLVGISKGRLADQAHRRQLIDYQISLWKRPAVHQESSTFSIRRDPE